MKKRSTAITCRIFQESERYQRADEVCDLLQEALENLDNAYQQIEEAVEC